MAEARDLAHAADPGHPVARPRLAGRSVRSGLLAAAVAAAVVVVGVVHRGILVSGGRALIGADREWLVPAVVATALIWVAGTVAQLGSIPIRPPIPRLFAVQVAASFANHLLPAGSGGMVVNVRFLERHGMSRGAALGSVGLNSLAGLVAHLSLCVGAVLVAPTALGGAGVRVGWPLPGRSGWIAGAAVAVTVAGLAVRAARAGRRARAAGRAGADPVRWYVRVGAAIARESNRLRTVAADPVRAATLWLGSLAAPLLHGAVLFGVLRAEGSGIPVLTVLATYLVASSLAALTPSPGGLGALDVTLVAGFVAVGTSPPAAVGAVLGYRLLTVWIPLLPGACVFAFLARFRVI